MQETFDARQALKNQLVSSVELDARLAIDAICVQLCAESTLGPTAITARLATATDLAGDGGAASRVVERVSGKPHGFGVSKVSVLRVSAGSVCVVDDALRPRWSGRLLI